MDGYAVSFISEVLARREAADRDYAVAMQEAWRKVAWALFEEWQDRRVRAIYARLEPYGA